MTAVLDRLPPIALAELNASAELLTRVDRKYLVTRTTAERLLHELSGAARALEIDDERRFGYRSVYLDTPAMTSYHAAAQGRRRRFKVRLRTYLTSGETFVEVKTRGQRGSTVKERMATSCARPLDADARAYVQMALTAGGIDAEVQHLTPTLTTEYDRTTLFTPSTLGRTTIDTDLAWILPDGSGFTAPSLAIVETKSAGSASDVDRLLWSMGQRPRTVSKYATGLAVLRPDLPSHKWRPVMRRHFTAIQHTTTTKENHA